MKHLAAAILVLFGIVVLMQFSNHLRMEWLLLRIEDLEKKLVIKP